jgi:hypothetical protein
MERHFIRELQMSLIVSVQQNVMGTPSSEKYNLKSQT